MIPSIQEQRLPMVTLVGCVKMSLQTNTSLIASPIGEADRKVQEETGKKRYNFKLSFVWGIPRTDDVEKIQKSSNSAVNYTLKSLRTSSLKEFISQDSVRGTRRYL